MTDSCPYCPVSLSCGDSMLHEVKLPTGQPISYLTHRACHHSASPETQDFVECEMIDAVLTERGRA